MKFEEGIEPKYQTAIEDALAAIIVNGNDEHRKVANAILASDMLMRVAPVSEVKASGVTGVRNWLFTNHRIDGEKLSIHEALAEVYMKIASETIDGGPRAVEGTFVHEGRHAYDFARLISSFSEADEKPLSIFDPTMYELEWAAHVAAGEYMLLVDKEEYVAEGCDLMILGRGEDGKCFLWNEGIECRLRDGYGLTPVENPGQLTSELLMLRER
jgi:hypothetical protein